MNFPSIEIQGSVLSADLLGKIRSEQATFQQGKDFQPDLTNAKLKDEISLAWQEAKGQWAIYKSKLARLKEGESGTTETRNFWIAPLLTNLGYNLSFNRQSEELNGKSFPIGYRDSSLDNYPVYVGGYHESLDKRPENKQLRVSPHALVQEYLNYSEHLYGLVTNGRLLRLLRDASRITRLSYVEFDLEKMMEEDLYSDFVILYRVLHASRMPKKADDGAESIIEHYHEEGLAAGSTIRNKLGDAVKKAILDLANGFINHPDNIGLRKLLSNGKLDPDEYYHHQLRIIYRLLFLFVIEERNLIYADNKTSETRRFANIYFNHYSLLRLRKLARKLPSPEAHRHHDLWQSLVGTFSLFERKEIGEKLGIMALQGDLFGYDAIGNQLYDLHHCHVSNAVLLNIISSLGYFDNESGVRIAVNYGGLDVEEFGSVYEGLLELKFKIDDIPGTGSYKIDFNSSNERGKSGSHYTPEELVQPLIKHSLEYLIEDRVKLYEQRKVTKEAAIQSLLQLKICDVACGSGHILLSAARRIALELARIQTGEEQPNPTAIRKALKAVVRNCIYGVDKNPLAIELCKIALWLEAYNPGEPLNFLDHHIKCGDAIVGLAHRGELENGIADEAFKALTLEEKEYKVPVSFEKTTEITFAAYLARRNKMERAGREVNAVQLKADFERNTENSVQEAMVEYKSFNQLPETTPDEIERKARAYKKFIDGKGFTFLKAMADTQVAQFFIPKTRVNKDYLMTDGDFRLILSGYKGWQDKKVAKATVVGLENRFFHWFIEFPEVFADGGFDCVLGNPPYLGGKKISGMFGDFYLNFIKEYYTPAGGLADLAVYFVRRDYRILSKKGFFSLILTNSIAQGDSRVGGLEYITKNEGRVVHAVKSLPWPGKAAVQVSLVTVTVSSIKVNYLLNNRSVERISSFLDVEDEANYYKLIANAKGSFIGTVITGDGFILSGEERRELIESDISNDDVISKFLIGDDLNSLPSQKPSRFVINFQDWPLEKAEKYKDCIKIVKEKVKPKRDKLNRDSYRKRWWQYAERCANLYENIKDKNECFVTSRVTKHLSFSLVNSDCIFSDAVVVINSNDFRKFSVIQSSFHYEWVQKLSSGLGNTIRYTPTDCFETFPFPMNPNSEEELQLEKAGKGYHEFRKQLMLDMQMGLTKAYNLFHYNAIVNLDTNEKDKQVLALRKHLEKIPNGISFQNVIEGIIHLRELHVQMDHAVLATYGWKDIVLRHGFYDVDYLPEIDRTRYTIHPEARKEILKRLLDLNHKIYAEEQATAEANKILSKKVSKASKIKKSEPQSLFPMRPETVYAGIYSIQDIVRITKLKSQTIKRWLNRLNTDHYEGISKDVNSRDQSLLLNFYGIHELIVIYDLRVKNKISLKDILDARAWLKKKLGSNNPGFYPFTSQKVLSVISKAGKQIIFTDDKTGDYITLGQGNSQLNLDFIKEILKRISFDKEMVGRLYLSDSKSIAIDPNLQGGRPCTVHNEILVDTIKSIYEQTKNIKYIADTYEISESVIKDALDFQHASALN